jgi:tetratricopeptide (TPR) repeat protein
MYCVRSHHPLPHPLPHLPHDAPHDVILLHLHSSHPPPHRPPQEQRPGFDSHCLLGEALLAIQEPEKAVAAFESALEFYPKDAALAVKCADALVAAHDYHRAVDYYNR